MDQAYAAVQVGFRQSVHQPGLSVQGNRTHGASHGADGINRAHGNTPLYCQRCETLLPRPYAEDKNGRRRIMSG